MVQKPARFIINPVAAGGATRRRWDRIRAQFGQLGYPWESIFTQGPGHAVVLARDAAREGCELVVAVGGDGTLNEVVNGLLQSERGGQIRLGILSLGTGGDFIRSLSGPYSQTTAYKRLTSDSGLLVDVGEAEFYRQGETRRRFFINVAGLGFDAAVVERTSRRLKALGRSSTYLLGLFTTLLSYRNKEVSLTVDGAKEQCIVNSVVVANGRYFGGGMFVAPTADITDGYFEVVVVGDMGKLELVRAVPSVYKGTHLSHPKVKSFRARSVEVHSQTQMLLQADGELLGEAPARLTIRPKALNLVV